MDLKYPVYRMAERFLIDCHDAGLDIIVTCTLRTEEEQAALYSQGRTEPGQIVTQAKPGQSMHQYGLALDVVPLRDGKCVWDKEDLLWQMVGNIGKGAGLDWAGDWVDFQEFPHFQYTGGLELAEIQKGKVPS
jgi:peptidoglycan L-alanyl-D-glutamate endopeptidase CwlK